MTYTVLWRPTAERQLAELWTGAADRGAVAAAADTVDALLRRDPLMRGESRSGAERIFFPAAPRSRISPLMNPTGSFTSVPWPAAAARPEWMAVGGGARSST